MEIFLAALLVGQMDEMLEFAVRVEGLGYFSVASSADNLAVEMEFYEDVEMAVRWDQLLASLLD